MTISPIDEHGRVYPYLRLLALREYQRVRRVASTTLGAAQADAS